MKRSKPSRRRLGVLTMVGLLLVTAIPVGIAVAEPGQEDSRRLGATLDQLSELLQRLEAELAVLERPAAERLEEGVEEALEAIERMIETLERPREEPDEEAWKVRIVELDLRLHRLVRILGEIVESTPRMPGRPNAESAIEDLRVWLDSRIIEASLGMTPEEYEQLVGAVYRTARVLGHRIAELAKRVEPKTAFPELARLVERLEDLLFRLDGFILHRFPRR